MRKIHKAGIVECDECGRKVLDLKRHKEILHKRFKIYSCPHCSDKYCTQEDLERHLIKVERNNVVKGVAGAGAPGVPVPMEARQQGVQAREASEPAEGPAEGAVDGAGAGAGAGSAKQMEAKTFSCSECGLKTPSRMTYIQHVLNGCIMDMVMGAPPDPAADPAMAPQPKKLKMGEAASPTAARS